VQQRACGALGELEYGGVDVEVLVVADCPNESGAVTIVRQALDDVGLKRVPIRTRVVASEQDAEELGFVGSPTIRINGADPFESRGRATGLACRVYVEHGVRSGLPDPRKLRQALKRHADVDRTE
jgi:hypothetical protein